MTRPGGGRGREGAGVTRRTFTAPRFTCRVEYPVDWHIWVGPLPHLELPRQVFALSNRSIAVPTGGRGRSRRVVEQLDGDAVLLWVHYRLPEDPDVAVADPVYYWGTRPDDRDDRQAAGPPVVPSTTLTWRRTGRGGEVSVSALAWEGAHVAPADAGRLHDVIATLAVEFSP